nr:hypothetical protein [Rubrivivax sp.]
MKRPLAWTLLAATAALSGCASVGPDEALSDARDWSSRSAAPPPLLALDDPTREQLRVERERLLDQPLTLSNALELALRGSPATQALLADGWRVQAGAAAVGGWPRVGLAFERASHGAEDIVTRTLAIGLTDLITLPARHALARDAVAAERLALAAEVLS